MKNTPMISARNLLVRYGKITALDSLTVDIPQGVVGVLGPNGAGKTTLIKVLLGLVTPHAGSFSVRGTDDLRDMVGYMPESHCLMGSMNAFELVSYMGRLSGMPGTEAIQRGHEVLDFVGLDEERYRTIDSYSTGMKQRVKLAQAIVHDPKILMLDEPTNGMDPPGRRDMLRLISRIGMFGKTILVSSHLLHEVEQICQHVMIIDEGKLLREGAMDQILSRDEGRYRLKVRGSPEELDGFSRAVGALYGVVSLFDEKGQTTMVLEGVKGGGEILTAARDTGVQIRYFRPDVLSLEDIFMEVFSGGDVGGY